LIDIIEEEKAERVEPEPEDAYGQILGEKSNNT